MLRRLLPVLLCFLSLPLLAQTVQPPTHETECDVQSSTTSTTASCTVTGLAGGETVILSTFRSSNTSLVSLTDSTGQVPLLFDTHVDGATVGFDGYVLANATAGSHTFTLTVATTDPYLGLRADVFANVPLANPIDVFSWNAPSCSGGTVLGAPLTTSTSNELIFAYARVSAGVLTAGAGFTLDAVQAYTNVAGETAVASTPGPVTASFGGYSSGYCDIRTVALRSLQAGSAGPPRHWTECDVQPSSSGTTAACTVNGLLGGEVILLNTFRTANSALVSLTDSAGQTPILFDTHLEPSSNAGMDGFILPNAVAGSHTFTLTIASAQTYVGLRADVFTNVPAASPMDSYSWTAPSTCGSNIFGAAVTTTQNNEKVFAYAHAGSATLTAAAGYTLYPSQSYANIAGEDTVLPGPGSATASFGGVSSGPCAVRTVTLKSAYAPTGYVTMTATNLQDQSGNGQRIQNATACFGLVNVSGTPIGVHVGGAGGGQAGPRPNCGPVNNGTLIGTWQPADATAGGTNMIPDPVFAGSLGTSWANPGGAWSIASGTGPNGTNLLLAGTAASQTTQSSSSAAIAVAPGNVYTIGGWIDASTVTAAEPELEVSNATGGAVLAEARQNAGTAGAVQTTFTVPAGVTGVNVLAAVHGATIGSGSIGFGTVLLQAGSSRLIDTNLSNPQNPGYLLTITDNVTGSTVLGGPASGYTMLQPQWTENSPLPCVNGLCDLGSYVPTTTPGVTAVVAPAPTLGVGGVTDNPGPATAYFSGNLLFLNIPPGSAAASGAANTVQVSDGLGALRPATGVTAANGRVTVNGGPLPYSSLAALSALAGDEVAVTDGGPSCAGGGGSPAWCYCSTASSGLCTSWTPMAGVSAVTGPPVHEIECDVQSSTASTTATCTVSGLQGGELILIGLYRYTNVALSSLTDSAGTPTHIESFATSTPNGFDFYYIANATPGSHVFTMTVASSTAYLGLKADVFYNVNPTSPIDAYRHDATSGYSGGVCTGTALSTTYNNDLLFGYIEGNAGTFTAGSGFTLYARQAAYANIASEGMTVPAAGSNAVSVNGASVACTIESIAIR